MLIQASEHSVELQPGLCDVWLLENTVLITQSGGYHMMAKLREKPPFRSGKHVRDVRDVDPLKPHYYIAKLGYAGVYIFFFFLFQNIDCGYS